MKVVVARHRGLLDDPPELPGMAHCMEHLWFHFPSSPRWRFWAETREHCTMFLYDVLPCDLSIFRHALAEHLQALSMPEQSYVDSPARLIALESALLQTQRGGGFPLKYIYGMLRGFDHFPPQDAAQFLALAPELQVPFEVAGHSWWYGSWAIECSEPDVELVDVRKLLPEPRGHVRYAEGSSRWIFHHGESTRVVRSDLHVTGLIWVWSGPEYCGRAIDLIQEALPQISGGRLRAIGSGRRSGSFLRDMDYLYVYSTAAPGRNGEVQAEWIREHLVASSSRLEAWAERSDKPEAEATRWLGELMRDWKVSGNGVSLQPWVLLDRLLQADASELSAGPLRADTMGGAGQWTVSP